MDEGERSCLVNELANYIYDGFINIKGMWTIESVTALIDRSLNRVVYMREGNDLVGVVIYFTITDLTLLRIISGEIDLTDIDTFKRVEKERGNNMHVFSIRAERMSLIVRGIKDVFRVKKFKTISWIKPDMSDIVVIKRKLECQHS